MPPENVFFTDVVEAGECGVVGLVRSLGEMMLQWADGSSEGSYAK